LVEFSKKFVKVETMKEIKMKAIDFSKNPNSQIK
jgi:hypothetical protein